MRKLLAFIVLIIGLLLPSFAQNPNRFVYVSTGPYAKRYHTNLHCGGFKDCVETGHYKAVTLDEALSMGRTHCQRKECNK